MARIRTIKPDFWTDEKLVECSTSARLFFIGTWNFADDSGNLPRSPKKLKMQIFPSDVIDCEPLILELIEQGLLVEYQVNNEKYLHIKGFAKHQRIDRASKTSIPPFQNDGNSSSPQRALVEHSTSTRRVFDEPSTTEGKGKEKEKERNSSRVVSSEGRDTREGFAEAAPPPLLDLPKSIEPKPIGRNADAVTEVAQGIVASLDQSIRVHFGEDTARLCPHPKDFLTAKSWAQAGASVTACADVIDGVVARQKAKGASPPQSLSYFERPIREALEKPRDENLDLSPAKPLQTKLSNDISTKLRKSGIDEAQIIRFFNEADFQENGKKIVVKTRFLRDWIANNFECQLGRAFGGIPEITVAA